MSSAFRWILVVVSALAGQGCVSRDRWLDCESDLVPINAPAPRAQDEGAVRTGAQPHAATSEHRP